MFFYKTKLWCKWLDRQEFDSLPTFDNSLHSNIWSFSSLVGKKFMIYWCIKNTSKYCSRNFSRAVCNQCGYKSVLHCLPNLNTQPSISWESYARWLTSDESGENCFQRKISPEFPDPCLVQISTAIKHFLPFSTTYNCEFGFSNLVEMKCKKRNQLDVEPHLWLKMSDTGLDIDTLVWDFKHHHPSQW
jgi:hypothetical protein